MTKCCDIKLSDLREAIVIERRGTLERTPIGSISEVWAPLATLSAKVVHLSGTEAAEAMRTQALATYQVFVHYVEDENGAPLYQTRDRMRWRGRVYDINYVFDLEGKHRWLRMLVTEGRIS